MKLYLKLGGFLLVACMNVHAAFSQSNLIYATGTPTKGGTGSVSGEANAALANDDYAELKASSLVLSTSAWLQLSFANEIASSSAAPATVYVKTSPFEKALLGGDVAVTVTSPAGVTLQSPGLRMFYTADGFGYLAITPSAAFKTIRITLSAPAIAGTNTLRVYYAFHSPGSYNASNPYPLSTADCGKPYLTGKAFSSGLLNKLDVSNPGFAIDDDISSKSSFVGDGLVVAGNIKQLFYFKGGSNSGDAVRVIFSKSASILALTLANKITVTAFDGDNQVGQATAVANLLEADLLGLLADVDKPVQFFFKPLNANGTVPVFDRIEVNLAIDGLGLALGSNGVNIHDVRRVPAAPTASNVIACTNVGTVSLAALASQAGISGIGNFQYKWYTTLRGTTPVNSSQSWTVTGLTTVGQSTYFVENSKTGTGCEFSPRKQVTVTTQNAPVSPSATLMP